MPLGPTFFEQKKILKRCRGLFYRCAGGAEARRFNRLLIEAGLIRGYSPCRILRADDIHTKSACDTSD